MIDFACKEFNLRDIVKCSLGLTKSDLIVFEHLLKQKDAIGTDHMATQLKLDQSTVQRAVKKLHEKNLVKRNQENLDGGGYVFHYQINDRKIIRKIILDTLTGWNARVEDELRKWCNTTG